jgi:hypothetical protein
VLELRSKGLSIKQIAMRLNRSEKTIRNHSSSGRATLGLRNPELLPLALYQHYHANLRGLPKASYKKGDMVFFDGVMRKVHGWAAPASVDLYIELIECDRKGRVRNGARVVRVHDLDRIIDITADLESAFQNAGLPLE